MDVLSPEGLGRATDRRLAEYFITLNDAAAAQWEHAAHTAAAPEVQKLLRATAAMERRLVDGLRLLLPRLTQ